jgi:hypothetical protein
MSHVVVTRMLYQDDDKFLDRLELYKKNLLPSLKKQINRHFDIAVLCNRKHADVLRKLGVTPFFLKDKKNFGQRDKTWHCKVKLSEIEGLGMYDIQSNIDSDDWVAKEYIDKVQVLSKRNKSAHIHFQPLLVNLKTGETKEMKNRYNGEPENGSAFYSLYQPNKKNFIYVGQDGHRRMGKYMERSILITSGYAFVGIHDKNDSTTWNA